jgi:basic amino acid/polyamine antiporter, APA family
MEKKLKLYDIYFIGLGYIVGAGIYSLLYLTTKHGKNYTWLSFLIGGIISIFTALSYSDLSNHFDSSSSEYDYITIGLTNNRFKKIIAYGLIGIGILMLVTLCLAFSNILKKLFKHVSYNLILISIILIPTIINIYDVKTTSNVNIGISILETGTLILLILLCFFGNYDNKLTTIAKNKSKDISWDGVIYGAFISIFAYAGFETIPKLADDTIKSKQNISKGMIYSLVSVIVLYIGVSLSVNKLLGYHKAGTIINPITEAYNVLLGSKSTKVINVITLLSIFNTILLTILFSSRQIYGISKKKVLPTIFKTVNKKTNTPIYSILVVSVIAYLLCLFTTINVSTHLSNTILLILFVLINLASIVMAYKGKISVNGFYFSKDKNKKSGNLSYYSIIGFVVSLGLLLKSLRII